jgi:hypothetical protein
MSEKLTDIPASVESPAKLAEQPPEEQGKKTADDGQERTDESVNAQFTSEDEAWRSYLENPSMGLSIAANDEDTAGALGNFVQIKNLEYRVFR